MKSIAVFCGSSSGVSPIYTDAAVQLGAYLAAQNITLVYGGSSVGLMGTLANTVLAEGGHVIGVMPTILARHEISHRALTELIFVESMHERKNKMMELGDGFIAMPGGAGTMEEFFEVFTWNQIGLLAKPCGLLNVANYYDGLISFFDHMTQEQFLQQKFRDSLIIADTPGDLLQKMHAFKAPGLKIF